MALGGWQAGPRGTAGKPGVQASQQGGGSAFSLRCLGSSVVASGWVHHWPAVRSWRCPSALGAACVQECGLVRSRGCRSHCRSHDHRSRPFVSFSVRVGGGSLVVSSWAVLLLPLALTLAASGSSLRAVALAAPPIRAVLLTDDKHITHVMCLGVECGGVGDQHDRKTKHLKTEQLRGAARREQGPAGGVAGLSA
jgi:hypothetical protein